MLLYSLVTSAGRPGQRVDTVRCAGRTAHSQRCPHRVDTRDALVYPTRSRLPHFCPRHLDDLLRPTPFTSRTTGAQVAFEGTYSSITYGVCY